MKTKVLFDSKKYLRKTPVIASLIDGNRNLVIKETLYFSRILITETEFYKRILLQTPESDEANALNQLQSTLLEKKHSTGRGAYIAMTIKPQGESVNDSVVCFLDEVLTGFAEVVVPSNEKVYTSFINDEVFIVINDQKIPDGIYEDYVEQKQLLTKEEEQFIEEAVYIQSSETWFPTKKEMLEKQKELMKEQKEMQKKEKGGIFSPQRKKKEVEKEVVTETGEYINPKSLKIHKGSSSPDYELSNIIGLEGVKKDIEKMKHMLEYEKNRKQRGIETHDISTLHMCYMGHPGTGKTTIARIMTGILFSMGYIKNNQCIEISGLDLQGGYVGQTAIITKQIVDMARGGILFIDEAYALCEDKENSYGKEAVSVLLKEMEDNRGDLIVILAGYEDDMNKFLNVNPGFRSRINKYFDFADYTTVELGKIFLNYLKKMHLLIDKEALKKCIELFKDAKKHPNFSNGRFVRNLTEKIEEEHILNCIDVSDARMDLVTIDDVPDAMMKQMLQGM